MEGDITSSASLRSAAAAAARLQHGVLVEERPRRSLSPPRASVDVSVIQRPGEKDYGFLVQLPNGKLVGTPPRQKPREPTSEEAYVARLEEDNGRRFLASLASSYGRSLADVLLTVDNPFPGDDDDDDENQPRKIHIIAPDIMQTLHTAVHDLTTAFQDTDLYAFPSSDDADDIIGYVINTDNRMFIQTFLQLASTEARQKGYFKPVHEQYAQNAELIKRQKMALFETLVHHYWDPDSQNFFYRPEVAGSMCSSRWRGPTRMYL